MKTILMSLILTVAATAFAHEGNDFQTITCRQINVASPEYALILERIGQSRNYGLNLIQGEEVVLKDVVRVTTEDVMAFFDGKKSKVRIYMDELDQSSFYTNDLDLDFDCRFDGRE